MGSGVLKMGRGGLKLLLQRTGKLARKIQKSSQH